MIWPQVIEIEIPRYTFCGYWCPHQLLKVSRWSLTMSCAGVEAPLPRRPVRVNKDLLKLLCIAVNKKEPTYFLLIEITSFLSLLCLFFVFTRVFWAFQQNKIQKTLKLYLQQLHGSYSWFQNMLKDMGCIMCTPRRAQSALPGNLVWLRACTGRLLLIIFT